jgi:O-methyltransferase domain/Dimerisation domain
MTADPDAMLQDELFRLLVGYQVSQALHVAAKLGLGDVLRDGPKTSTEIAMSVGADEPSLVRFLRFLAAQDILTEDDRGAFATTAMGALLRSDHPHSIHPWAALLGAPIIWLPWGELYQTVMTGQPAFDRIYGEAYFRYLEHSPDDAALFNAAMSDDPSLPILEAYDFSGCTQIVDVAGGQGVLLQAILERNPQARGVLYDLPFVVDAALDLKDSAVSSRCALVGGDMFQSIPTGGDAYILKRIIHDWNDTEAITILRNCRQAMANHGRILLVEQIFQDDEKSPASDLMMLVLVTGRERTENEFRALFTAAGLTLSRVISAGDYSVIEGVSA